MIQLDVNGSEGFSATFSYDPLVVDTIRQVPGFKWNKTRRAWLSEGPEVLLDLDRLRIARNVTTRADDRAAGFYRQLALIASERARSVNGDPYGYQLVGTSVLVAQKRGLLGDDPGLGKTKQAIDAALDVRAESVLVVAPKTITYNWLDELEKWYPEVTVSLLPDDKKQREAFWREDDSRFKIVNYEKLLLDDFPIQQRWDCLIADEVHVAKNPRAQRSKRLREIAKRSGHVFVLSGTPMEMRPEELHGVFSVFRPSVLGDFWRFREQHLLTSSWGEVLGVRNPELLRERIAPWLLRRRKDEVLTLPPKLYNTHYVELDGNEKQVYRQMKRDFTDWLEEQGRDASEANKLTQLLRLQQFTSSPELVRVHRTGSKAQALMDVLNEWPGKAVVFTRFAEMATLLCDWLGTEYLIAGEVEAEERLATVKRFNDEPLARVLVSTDAGRLGLNITGADLAVHYDSLFNPAAMWQREDRLHRIGQQRTVNVVTLVCRDTIDQGMQRILEKRRDLFTDIIEGAAETQVTRRLGVGSLMKLIEGRT